MTVLQITLIAASLINCLAPDFHIAGTVIIHWTSLHWKSAFGFACFSSLKNSSFRYFMTAVNTSMIGSFRSFSLLVVAKSLFMSNHYRKIEYVATMTIMIV